MPLFDWLKRKPAGPAPGMIVLLDKLPAIDIARACAALAAIEPLRLKPRMRMEGPAGEASFDAHDIAIACVEAAAPAGVIEKTLGACNWTGEALAAMKSHTAHLKLAHNGGSASMAEKYIALYKLAAVLGGDNLRGVLLEQAWTCAPAPLVQEFTGAAMLKACREQPPPVLFTGFVKFKTDDGAWFASKGHHMFGVPDFAMHGPEEKPAMVLDLFMNIFLYVNTRRARIAAGHTLQIADDVFLKFAALAENNPWREWLLGAGDTLEVKRITKEEINKTRSKG